MGVFLVPFEQVLATTIPNMGPLRIVVARVLTEDVRQDSIPGNPLLQLCHPFRSNYINITGIHRHGEEQAINRSPRVYHLDPILFRVLCVGASL